MSRLQTNAIRHLGSTADNIKLDSSGRVTMPNQPAFQVNGASSGSTAGGVVIAFSDAALTKSTFNTGNHWNNSTNRFTAPVAGKYLFFANVYYQNAASTYAAIAPRINGSQVTPGDTFMLFNGGTVNLGTADSQVKGSFIFNLSANDYVDLTLRTGANALTIYAGHSVFGGYLLG